MKEALPERLLREKTLADFDVFVNDELIPDWSEVSVPAGIVWYYERDENGLIICEYGADGEIIPKEKLLRGKIRIERRRQVRHLHVSKSEKNDR
jgi:hypothetical protein